MPMIISHAPIIIQIHIKEMCIILSIQMELHRKHFVEIINSLQIVPMDKHFYWVKIL